MALAAADSVLVLSGGRIETTTEAGREGVLDITVVVALTSLVTVGVLLARVRPGHPIAAMLQVIGLGGFVTIVASAYAGLAIQTGRALPGLEYAAWLSNWIWLPVVAVGLYFLPVMFPDGRLPSPVWRAVGGVAVPAVAAAAVATAFLDGPLQPPLQAIENPLGLPGADSVLRPLEALGYAAVTLLPLATVVALASRFRRSNTVERAQLKWFVASCVPFLVGMTLASVTYEDRSLALLNDVSIIAAVVGLAAIPLAIGLAIQRYRLYDIDRVISRTILYGLVTAILAATFGAIVLGSQAALAGATEGQSIPVAISTLVVVALFQPLKARLGDAVDRRFYRARYDAARVGERFAERLRDEVAIGALSDELMRTVRATVAPMDAALWIRNPRGR
jgi:hypothetical protein